MCYSFLLCLLVPLLELERSIRRQENGTGILIEAFKLKERRAMLSQRTTRLPSRRTAVVE